MSLCLNEERNLFGRVTGRIVKLYVKLVFGWIYSTFDSIFQPVNINYRHKIMSTADFSQSETS